MDNESNSLESLFSAPASGRMLSMDMGKYVADCYSGEPAPCAPACPLGLNIPEFLLKMRRGNFKGAYNLLRDYTIFPDISRLICGHLCMGACARKDFDSPLELGKLEKAAIDFAGSLAPTRYNIPGKNKTVAIVGAGLSGLSCMVRLASRGYDTVVFEKSGSVGGRLWDLFPDGAFINEIELQTGHLRYDLRTESEIASLNGLESFDAVLLACGAGGNDFGMLETLNRDSLGSLAHGLFLGGGLIGSSPAESIENGIRAAQSIESYLKTGRMHEMMGLNLKKASRLKVNHTIFRDAESPASDVYTSEQAIQEASRCPRCDCSDCFRACDFMKYYNKLPKKIVNDVRVRLNPVEGLQGSSGTRMINSCNACGLCAGVCTENIDMGGFLLKTRSILHREGSLPPAFHDFWLRDMRSAQGEKAYLAQNAPGCKTSRYLFFPGCQLGASYPAYVEKTYEYLQRRLPGTGILLSCCGAPAEWAGDTDAAAETAAGIDKVRKDMGSPEIIHACPSCEKMFAKYLPDIKRVSVYEVIRRLGIPDGVARGGAVSVFDPCSSRLDAGMQENVRALVNMTGLSIEELPYAKREALCCGFGGHIYPANADLAGRIAKNRVDLSPLPYITYCANCRDIFSGNGKNCSHVLGLVFGLEDGSRKTPSLSKKRSNREALKRRLLQWEPGQEETLEGFEYEIAPADGLEAKLDRLLILEGDIRETIDYCERTGAKLLDPATGYYVGHRRLGIVTYWVEYRMNGRLCELRNAYSHRMQIEGE